MASIPIFDAAHLQGICDIIADTSSGLSGSEIGRLLYALGIDDLQPSITKRHRLFAALDERQRRDACGNHVVAFIHSAMEPVRYAGNPHSFVERRDSLNAVLIYCGYGLGEDGKLSKQVAARTITEAEQRAGKLRSELLRRSVHHDVLRFCRAELLQNNYFHAVFEATKSVADKIRQRSGLPQDGSELIDAAFGMGQVSMPFLAFNSLQTQTERSEHTGLMNLMKGMFGTFRNVTAHAPKISWRITEHDALDLLSMASLLHRRLDAAVRTPRQI